MSMRPPFNRIVSNNVRALDYCIASALGRKDCQLPLSVATRRQSPGASSPRVRGAIAGRRKRVGLLPLQLLEPFFVIGERVRCAADYAVHGGKAVPGFLTASLELPVGATDFLVEQVDALTSRFSTPFVRASVKPSQRIGKRRSPISVGAPTARARQAVRAEHGLAEEAPVSDKAASCRRVTHGVFVAIP